MGIDGPSTTRPEPADRVTFTAHLRYVHGWAQRDFDQYTLGEDDLGTGESLLKLAVAHVDDHEHADQHGRSDHSVDDIKEVTTKRLAEALHALGPELRQGLGEHPQ